MSIRERRRGRALPTEDVVFPADQAARAAAHTELEEATAAVHEARRRGSPPPEVAERLAAAERAVDELAVDRFTVRALTSDDWDVLVGEHPPAADADEGAQWDPVTFFPALLEETVVQVADDGSESSTAAEWVEMRRDGSFTPGQWNTLVNTALRLSTTVTLVSDAVGKGSRGTRS